MYEELGSIKEIVALSPQETLDSAATLLVQLGYEIGQRSDDSVTAIRRKREGMFGHSLQNLTVAALPQSGGGVKVELRAPTARGSKKDRASGPSGPTTCLSSGRSMSKNKQRRVKRVRRR